MWVLGAAAWGVVALLSTSACKSGAESAAGLQTSRELGSRAVGSHSFPALGSPGREAAL